MIEKSLALLDKAATQEEQLFYAFQIRNIRDGWKQPQREQYFKWLNRASSNTPAAPATRFFFRMCAAMR